MKKIFLSITLCFSLFFCLALPMAFADSASLTDQSENNTYSVSSAYEYVVKPNTQEWKKLTSTEEKIKVTQIPDALLSKMTTQALVETVLNYPLLPNIYAFNTEQEGFNAVYGSFNGLQELAKRSDVIIELEKKQSNISYLNTTDTDITLEGIYVETLLEGIGSKGRAHFNSVITPYATNSSVKTPKGSNVSTLKNVTWADHKTTEKKAALEQTELQKIYPNATLLSTKNPSYNCHSYAWYSTSSSNTHWMNSASAYRTDGSYTKGTAKVGSKVDYGAGDHSAIVTGVGQGSGPNINVKSKWGALGVFSHNIVDCPYTMNSYSCTFWN